MLKFIREQSPRIAYAMLAGLYLIWAIGIHVPVVPILMSMSYILLFVSKHPNPD